MQVAAGQVDPHACRLQLGQSPGGVEHFCRAVRDVVTSQLPDIGRNGPEGRIVVDFEQLAEVQPRDVVGVPCRQHVVLRIGQLRSDLQQVGRRNLAGLDLLGRLLFLYPQFRHDLFGVADRLLGTQYLQIIGRNVHPHVVAHLLHGEQRRAQVELRAFEVVVVLQPSEEQDIRPERRAVARHGLVLHELIGRLVENASCRERYAGRGGEIGSIVPFRFGQCNAFFRGREFLCFDFDVVLVGMRNALFQRPAALLCEAGGAEEQQQSERYDVRSSHTAHRFLKSDTTGWMKRSISRMSSVTISAVPSIR